MDFARKQLEKYGWTDGKGLGRHENGIPEAIKPKLKRSAAGIGHDPASEFNEHWWTALYDKAAGNVEVQEKNGKTKKFKTKDDFQITNSTWKLKHKQKIEGNEKQYSEFFVRTAILTNGGSKVEKVRESEFEEDEKRDVFKMTDEELFKACGGRTAHKGARHGLKATGKLARIALQEALLLSESRFNGYSHAKKLKSMKVEEMNLNSDNDEINQIKKKKKKRKRCHSNEKIDNIKSDYTKTELEMEIKVALPVNNEVTEDDNVTRVLKISKKSKKSKRKNFNCGEVIEKDDSEICKKKIKLYPGDTLEVANEESVNHNEINSKTKRKKKKRID